MEPEAQVIGATDLERGSSAADDELEGLVKPKHCAAEAAARKWPHAVSQDALLAAVFERLAGAAKEEQLGVDSQRARDTPAKRNRRETYLDPTVRRKWQDRARRFLQRRPATLDEQPVATLYSMVFLQHLLELDAADASLPPDLRRFEDSYTDGVSDQFLLDAARGRYTVKGEVFHFAQAREGEAQAAFVARLVEALRRCTPPALLGRVTTAMSQSGLAALERASLCAVAVSGGKQDVDYALRVNAAHPDEVMVTLRVHRRGFTEYLLESTEASRGEEADPGPRPSDAASSVQKSATAAFTVQGHVDVVAFEEEVDIRLDGQPVPLGAISDPMLGLARDHVPGAAAPERLLLRHLLARLRGCCPRRRLAEGTEAEGAEGP